MLYQGVPLLKCIENSVKGRQGSRDFISCFIMFAWNQNISSDGTFLWYRPFSLSMNLLQMKCNRMLLCIWHFENFVNVMGR